MKLLDIFGETLNYIVDFICKGKNNFLYEYFNLAPVPLRYRIMLQIGIGVAIYVVIHSIVSFIISEIYEAWWRYKRKK